MAAEQLIAYAARIRELLRANPNTPETGLAPAFQQLVTDLLPVLPAGPGVTVSPEYAKENTGRPDIALIRPGQLPRAFIELKLPKKHLEPTLWRDAHDKRQFERFRELPVWALSNFNGIRLFVRDRAEPEVMIVPAVALLAETSDVKAEQLIRAHDAAPLLDVINGLAQAQPPSPSNAAQLAEFLAHAARLVRASAVERLNELRNAKAEGRPLQVVRDYFRNVLYAHPEAGGYRGEFDTLFSAAFAQTLAFGLLLVREATGKPVGPDSWQIMPDEHPLMKTALRVLSEQEIVEQIDLGFDVLIDTVNGLDPRILAQKPGRPDPILYFYEDFLATFDADAKQRYGVYYTPVEVVRYMVGALDRALRENLKTKGISDQEVTILDPATGTGTFLLGIAERVREEATRASGPGAAWPALGQLAERMFGFELLIGPYAVAHYRLHHALAEKPQPDAPAPPPLPRLGIYLADTLARAGTSTPLGGLGYIAEPIRHERDEADRIKREQRILAIIGNPPYWRFQGVNTRETVGPFIDDKWEDLKGPVRDAGWSNQLNTFPEFSVAFWRWAIWKLFEADNAPKKGVIAFITNRTFLAGKPYAGLRKMLRERFDRIEIIVQAYVDWPRPELQSVWGVENVSLFAMAFGTGEGPATWCHALLPDRHAFSGRGGYTFPLYDQRAGHVAINLNRRLLEGLALTYAAPVEPEAVFDATLGFLSATSYTLRFAEDLEDVFPHVPFPADKRLFDRAAEVGKLIREVETFARSPAPEFLTSEIARIETAPHGRLADIGPESWSEGDLILCANGSGKVSGIPRAVWEFAVSGYPLLPRWLAARKGVEVTHDFLTEFRDITGRINELIYRFDEADVVLQEALNHSLTRDQLGLEPTRGGTSNERP